MHETAYELGEKFFKIYCKDTDTILDIGSFNMNGTLEIFVRKMQNIPESIYVLVKELI